MKPPRALLFVYSNKNIAGCVLALGALGAFFGGVIHDFWPEIVAGAYAIGYFATPTQQSIDSDYEASMNPQAIAAELARLGTRVENLVPADVFALLQSIVASIDSVLPALRAAAGLGEQESFTIRQTALHYLPETLQAYLQLPPAFRNVQPMHDGKTAKALLVEQLSLLDAKMKDIGANVMTNNTQELVANGQFLRDKFATQNFLTPVS